MSIEFDTIVYHQFCPDGIAGLWCAYKYNNEFEQIKMHAGIDPSFDTIDKNIIFIDVCPSYNFLLVHTKLAKSITILDHHKSAYDIYNDKKEILDTIDNLKVVFDMERCGSQIAWDYFFGVERPWFIDYVGDRDLWKWELPNSKEICAAFDFIELFNENNFNKIDAISNYDENEINSLVEVGRTINKYQDNLVKKELPNRIEATIRINESEYNVNIGTISVNLVSKLGNELTKQKMKDNTMPDFAVVWNYNIINNTFNISIRGHDTSPDLSAIAKHFGGGGHGKASGFRIIGRKRFKEIFSFI